MAQTPSHTAAGEAEPAGSGASAPPSLPPRNESSAREEIGPRADTVWTSAGARRPAASGGAAIGGVVGRTVKGPHGRVAIVDGCRTPFVKADTVFRAMDVIDLAGVVASELAARGPVDPAEIDLSIFGVVVPALHAPNLGREVVFRASLPMSIPGTTVNLACASANRAITSGAEAILSGQCNTVLAGGAESLSDVPIRFSRRAAQLFMELDKARSLPRKLAVIGKLRPRDLAPVPPAIAEYSTGMTMGQACEKMAMENDISRRAQDEIALLSHQRAASATAEGRFNGQIVPTFPPPAFDQPVLADGGVRTDSSLDALAALPPVFDKRYGTLTAGNSSPITDGAAAVLLMSEAKARAAGIEPLGYIRSWAYCSVDPGGQLLQGPAYAAPAALEAAGLTLADIDLVEMHEAFAAQVLSNLKAFASPRFARDELGRSSPLGELELERVNVNGGSIALGHPFGATGARVTIQLLAELKRRGLGLGMITVCAAGGVGFAMVVER